MNYIAFHCGEFSWLMEVTLRCSEKKKSCTAEISRCYYPYFLPHICLGGCYILDKVSKGNETPCLIFTLACRDTY